jgi:molybdate transport system ATP-binding protein
MLDLHVIKQQGDFGVDAAFVSSEVGVTALFGRSGAGKTSVVNMVAGLVRPDRGHITVNGRVLFDSEKGTHVPPEKRRMGYIFQDGRLFPHLSVKSNLTFGMRFTTDAKLRVGFEAVVALLGIEHLLHRRPARLSGGEKQRVAIGRALLTNPSLLLMDEPLASLDRRRKAEVLPFLSRLCGEFSIPILYVSHSLSEILNLADTMVLMDGGRVTAAGPIEDLVNRVELQRLTGADGLETVITTTVKGHEAGMTRLLFAGGKMWVPKIDAPSGSRVRVLVAARSVVIALEQPRSTSVQNIFRGRIETIIPGPGELVDVRIDIGCPLLARITPRALQALELFPGKPVYAMVKSVAISRGHFNSTVHEADGF